MSSFLLFQECGGGSHPGLFGDRNQMIPHAPGTFNRDRWGRVADREPRSDYGVALAPERTNSLASTSMSGLSCHCPSGLRSYSRATPMGSKPTFS
jgi:hypothetical protein